ncbi:hypothetical protein [Chakrabartyella piscis]|uniref:hypothetical protein n=1 Tax=Chakrabartyella piscis TaxID=2918914 RepID=UPI0029588F8E|nr:hypothetical protein [Chakrabartyella piscis]
MNRRCRRPHHNPFCFILGILSVVLGFGIILGTLLPWCNLFLALIFIATGIWLICQNKFH